MSDFSIVTATFNAGGSIRRCLQSVRENRLAETEHLVIDNQSSDDTLEKVRAFGNVRVISEKDNGIYEAMNKLIGKFKPDEVAIEELFFNTNITTGIKVAEARGVILLSTIQSCGKLYEYTPLMIKQALTGNGRADKHQVQYMVQMLLNLKTIPRPDDAADALAAAVCHANMCSFNQRII